MKVALVTVWLSFLAACFGGSTKQNRYFVLHMNPSNTSPGAVIPGLARVRNLDAESTYDKFQIVVRRNPYELSYRDTDVWAVKPNRMISDLIARRLQEYGLFSGVTRELGEQRPDYTLDGDLHAVELYDSGDRLFAHLSLSLRLARFRDGEVMWTYSFNQRREVPTLEFAHAIRILSELLDEAAGEAFTQMARLGDPVEEVIELPQGSQQFPLSATPGQPTTEPTLGEEEVDPSPIFLPEDPPTDATGGAEEKPEDE